MQNNFFLSATWKQILKQSFGAESIDYIVAEEKLIISKFKKSLLTIAYPNFPIGIKSLEAAKIMTSDLSFLKKVNVSAQRLIIQHEDFDEGKSIPAQIKKQPMSLIQDLQGWSIDNLTSSIRRNIRKSKKNKIEIRAISNIHEADSIFNLYVQTVKRHSGKVRYNREYFIQLVNAILCESDITGYVALHGNGELIGYMISAYQNEVAYYLHGGIDYKYQKYRVMDALFAQSIVTAKDLGLLNFNFLTSPPNQPDLVRYKEKWGAKTQIIHTVTFTKSKLANKLLSLHNK